MVILMEFRFVVILFIEVEGVEGLDLGVIFDILID